MVRRGGGVLLAILLFVGVIVGVAWRRDRAEPPRAVTDGGEAAGGRDERPGSRRGEAASARRTPTNAERLKRDALRESILRALANRQPPTAAPTPKGQNPTEPRAPFPEGHLNDRIGGRDVLVGFLNKQLMPLAHECIELAQQQSPGLAGTLALNVETVAQPGLGAVIDGAAAADGNEVADPGLLECIRESAFSLHLPPSAASGREKFQLTMPIEARLDGGGH